MDSLLVRSNSSLKRFCKIIALISVLFLAYGFFIEPFWVATKRVEVDSPILSGFFRDNTVVFISDLHVSPWGLREKIVLKKLKAISPDYIFLGGDYVSWSGNYNQAFNFLKQLKAKKGIFGVLGEADYQNSRNSCKFCHRFGADDPELPVHMLRNQTVTLNSGVELFGIESFNHSFEQGRQMLQSDSDLTRLILSHKQFEPDFLKSNEIILCGDTHGAQIFLPNVIWQALFKSSKGGIRSGQSDKTIVTTGIGTSRVHFRLFCRPEIVLFHAKN